jgi:hypothetical protein
MKLPIRCPICNEIMLTDYNGTYLINKNCSKNITHKITFDAISKDDCIVNITFTSSMWLNATVSWHYSTNLGPIVNIIIKDKPGIILPLFEPDFSDCRKLIEKLKTYIVFS